MNQRAGIRKKSFANLAGLPGTGGHVERHIDHDRSTDDVIARDAAPEAAIVGIGAVVTHGEITVVRDAVRKAKIGVAGGSGTRRRRLTGADGVGLVEFLSVDPDGTAAQFDGVAGEA